MKPREDFEASIKAKEDELLALQTLNIDEEKRKILQREGIQLAEEHRGCYRNTEFFFAIDTMFFNRGYGIPVLILIENKVFYD